MKMKYYEIYVITNAFIFNNDNIINETPNGLEKQDPLAHLLLQLFFGGDVPVLTDLIKDLQFLLVAV